MPKSVTFDREQVIENVTELFWKKGYNGTSMQDLVNVTGLNRSSFYNSFGDKFTLFLEALKHYQSRQRDYLQELSNTAKTPKEAIQSLFEGISQELASEQETKGCFISNCISELGNQDAQVHRFLVENKDQMVNTFKILIQEAQQQGEIDASKDAKTLALYLFSNLNGLRITSMIESDIQGVTDLIISVL